MTRGRAALHGAYRGGNFGDMLLLGIYARWIRALVPGCRVVLPLIKSGLGDLVDADGRGLRELRRARALVYGGGGYFGELNTGVGWWAIRNTWRHVPQGLVARLCGPRRWPTGPSWRGHRPRLRGKGTRLQPGGERLSADRVCPGPGRARELPHCTTT